MTRFIRNLGLFIVFSFIVYVVGICIAGLLLPESLLKNLSYNKGKGGYLLTRLAEADTTTNVDVLILGSSHAYRSVDPRIFSKHGISVFNLGSSAQTFLQTKFIVEKYLAQMNPKLVLIESFPLILGLDGVESSLDIIANASIDYKTVDMILEVNHIKVYNSFIYSYFGHVFELDNGFEETLSKDNGDSYIYGGYVQTFKQALFYKSKYEAENLIIENTQLESLKFIVDYLKSKGIDYYLIQTPILPAKFESYGNTREIDSIYSSYGKHINFNCEIHLSDTMFYDDNHLNQYGVSLFNKKLLECPYEEKLFGNILDSRHNL